MASRSHVIRHLVLLSGAALCGPLLLAQAPAISPPAAGRVVLISLDGMGTRLFLDDPVSEELRTLRSLRARGVMADGLVAHMPSTTANTHAALWTGAWGDVNGITANEMPLPPREAHPAAATVSGYRSEGLRAEPLWVRDGATGRAHRGPAGHAGLSARATSSPEAVSPRRPQCSTAIRHRSWRRRAGSSRAT